MKGISKKYAVYTALIVACLLATSDVFAQANALNLIGSGQADQVNLFEVATRDRSVTYLSYIFGDVGGLLDSTGQGLLGSMFEVFNSTMWTGWVLRFMLRLQRSYLPPKVETP